ncbi:MAG: hypothetical protein ACKVOW_02720, partial [Chitinophagaceae bacterium]
MIVKKVPGAKEVQMVYDARDRLIMTQDANLKNAGKWMVTIYDDQNRPINTGLWNSVLTGDQHRTNAFTVTNYPFTISTIPASGFELLSETYYDTYSALPAGLQTFDNSFSASLLAPSNSSFPYPQGYTPMPIARGMITGTKIKVLGTASQFLYTASFYDDKGRVVQAKSQNTTGGVDIVTTQYSYVGQVLVMVQRQQNATAGNPQTHTIITKMEYDDAGRLLQVKKSVSSIINGVTVTKAEQPIVSNQYNTVGQLRSKKLSPTYNSNAGLETLTSEYNIRGWLTGINRGYLLDRGASGYSENYFGFEMGYDKTTTKPGTTSFANAQFNGNISGVIWKSAGDEIRRKFDYGYDNINRLLKADFVQNDAGSTWSNTNMKFSVQMGDGLDPTTAYDANGNIKQLSQYGWKVGTPGALIDQINYAYMNTGNSNKLLAVTDVVTGDNKLGDLTDKNTSADDYLYDDNGNLTIDKNKKITAITYNHLNLPLVITIKKDDGVTDKGTISYTYDASGNKLQKTVLDKTVTPNKTTVTTYVGG